MVISKKYIVKNMAKNREWEINASRGEKILAEKVCCDYFPKWGKEHYLCMYYIFGDKLKGMNKCYRKAYLDSIYARHSGIVLPWEMLTILISVLAIMITASLSMIPILSGINPGSAIEVKNLLLIWIWLLATVLLLCVARLFIQTSNEFMIALIKRLIKDYVEK